MKTQKYFQILTLLIFSPTIWGIEVSVSIEGIEDKRIIKNIESHISLKQYEKEQDASLEQIELLHLRAKEEITAAVQPFGYYHAQIISDFHHEPNLVKATYTISLGAPTLINAISLNLDGPGVSNTNLGDVFSDFPLKRGDVFLHEAYEQGKKNAQQAAYQEGYIKAFFSKHQVIVDLSQHEAELDLELQTGPQYTFGDIEFNKSYYSDAFLSRFTRLSPNAPYRSDTVVELESRLFQSNLFKQIEMVPVVLDKTTQVPLQVNIEDAPANRYLLGLGYDTDTKSRLRAGWDRKKITKSGHQLKTHFKLSEKDTLLDAAYVIPGKKPWIDHYRFALNYADGEYKGRPSELYSFEASETRELFDIHRTLALRYLNENFTDSDGKKERSSFLLPSLRLSKTKIDNLINPRNGYKAEFFVRGGIDSLFSDADFIQFYFHYKWLKALSDKSTFISRVEFGATLPDNIDKLPLSIRFYAGGIDSLRGFRYRSLPFEVNEEGHLKPVGGAYLALASLEVDHTIWGPLKGAIFLDGGSAVRKLSDNWQLAAGFGLRWQTPIGPLKIDLAKPLTNGAEVWRLHFSFGPQL